jgi:EAL domain-containing protein (putative c-di-GMP-specific phosphodiesterase class I)
LAFDLNQHRVFVSASIGIVLSAPQYARSEEILRDADIAMYRAKALGRGRSEVFDLEMRVHAMSRLELESDLRNALEQRAFSVFYQPIVSLATNRIVGFEALARWRHPQRGIVAPADFIPLAEETGLIIPIGQWVLQEACRQMRAWQMQFPQEPPLTISVNLSTKQFAQADLIENVTAILDETGLAAQSLKLELTESLVVEDSQTASQMLERLREIGVQVQIDDFGTGYSSLGYLHHLPIDTLKIDRTFISRIGVNGNGGEIIRTILTLAHDLGMKVIAEGVETADQLAKLRGLDCEFGQGYLFAKPTDSIRAGELIAESGAARKLDTGTPPLQMI